MNMASLEAVVYPQEYPVYHSNYRDCNNHFFFYDHDLGFQEDQDKLLLSILDQQQHQESLHAMESSSPSVVQNSKDYQLYQNNSSPETNCTVDHDQSSFDHGLLMPRVELLPPGSTTTTGRRKRRRTRSAKNKEEIENQRMTHIAVERNRRKQMNEYLAALRSLMPASYVQRGDQASIIGGAINFVKELEQQLQTMEANKRTKQQTETNENGKPISPFAEFFSFPQYTTHATTSPGINEPNGNHKLGVADIEVTMVETHANLKILSKKRPRQLLNLVAGLQSLRLSVQHLNVTTVDQMVMYSISVKIEEGCHLSTVDEIAAAVNQMLQRIAEDNNVTSTTFS